MCRDAGKAHLLGKTLDLGKAYRQVAVHPDSRKHAVLGFPGVGRMAVLCGKVLLFGATASVYAFNKLALAILHIMIVKFHMIATDFYDDFTLFEFQPAASPLDKVAMRFLSNLGWTFARDGKKFVPFGSSVVSLGVALDLSGVWDGFLTVSNKPGGLERIAYVLQPIADGRDVTRADLASLHGLINFAGGYVMGFELKPMARAVQGVVGALSRQHCRAPPGVPSGPGCLSTVQTAKMPGEQLVFYTDGVFEDGIGSWGSLFLDRTGRTRLLFGGRVAQGLTQHWHESAGEQVICQVEAYAFAESLFGLRGQVRGRTMIVFIYNEPCRLGFIKRTSPSASMMGLIALVSLFEGALGVTLWYERVPSKSNPADLPSRGLMQEAASRFGAMVKGDLVCTQVMSNFLVSSAYGPTLAKASASALSLEAETLLS